MFSEFKEFALKGNIIDLALAVIIGGAFGKIVTSLVNDIIMPAVGVIVGGVKFTNLALTLKQSTATSEAVTLNYGNFIQASVDFFIIAFALFLAVHFANKLQRKKVEIAEEVVGETVQEDILLLREIRDALRN